MLQPKQGYNEVLPRWNPFIRTVRRSLIFQHRIVDIPTETLFHILRQLPRSDLLNILMSCRKFFRPAVYLLYRDVRLTNSTAMRFSVTILNRPSLYDAYCKYVTRLEFCSLSVVDAYTTFTILSQALSLCSELVDLRLYVQPSTVPFFARRLRDSLIILDDSKNDNEVGSPILHNNISLPRLRFLAVGGSVELVSICSFRFLSDLFLKFTMDSTTLLNMLEILRHSSSGGTLRNLTVKLMPSIDLEWAVRTISGVVGQLTGFCVFKPLTTITVRVNWSKLYRYKAHIKSSGSRRGLGIYSGDLPMHWSYIH